MPISTKGALTLFMRFRIINVLIFLSETVPDEQRFCYYFKDEKTKKQKKEKMRQPGLSRDLLSLSNPDQSLGKALS